MELCERIFNDMIEEVGFFELHYFEKAILKDFQKKSAFCKEFPKNTDE